METSEKKWSALCPTRELPERLQRLVEFRRTGGTPEDNVSYAFCWYKTPEGADFWNNVYEGIVPSNLEGILTGFEKEHPELLKPKQAEGTTSEKVEKKLWPCVKCTAEQYEQIRGKLHELGYTDDGRYYISERWDYFPILQTKYYQDHNDQIIGNYDHCDCKGQYLCPDIPTFLHDCREVAIREGWFKEEQPEEMKWQPHCDISELPTRLRRFAEYRKMYSDRAYPGDYPDSVCFFSWHNLPEGGDFWNAVFEGIAPANLDEVLEDFEHNNSDFVKYTGPNDTEVVEDVGDMEDIDDIEQELVPTLAEARRQFRELTKLYTVEELSKPELPRSWEEYIEQNPIADERTAEVKKKAAALEKLVLMRDKWREGWTPVEDERNYGIQRDCDGLAVGGHSFLQACLAFPTEEMAEDFLNTFRDLIEEAGDLI